MLLPHAAAPLRSSGSPSHRTCSVLAAMQHRAPHTLACHFVGFGGAVLFFPVFVLFFCFFKRSPLHIYLSSAILFFFLIMLFRLGIVELRLGSPNLAGAPPNKVGLSELLQTPKRHWCLHWKLAGKTEAVWLPDLPLMTAGPLLTHHIHASLLTPRD